MSNLRPAGLIFNPKAGKSPRSGRMESLVENLRGRGFEVDPTATEAPGHATQLASRAAQSGAVEVLFVLGGDGTIREAAAGLLGSRLPLAILPGGTANVLALSVGIPRQAEAASTAYDGRGPLLVRPMDVGLCGARPFLMMTSIGLDAQVMAHLDSGRKRRWGRLAVAYQSIVEWCTYDYPRVGLEASGQSFEGSLAVVSNIPYYGGRVRMAPQASAEDGRLDLLVFRGSGALATLAFALDLLRRKHLRRRDVDSVSALEVVIQGRGPAVVQIDGDAVETDLPITVTLAPEKLWLLRPSKA